jgi:type I restriction enzyme S subunit
VAVPSYNEQKEIAEYIERKCAAIDALIEKKQQFIDELTAYKKSLIYEYVTGKREVPV